MTENKKVNEKKRYRTVRVSMDTYQKLSFIMGSEMRERRKYVPYDTAIGLICDLYLEKNSTHKKKKKRSEET